jgi:hypothetical protein
MSMNINQHYLHSNLAPIVKKKINENIIIIIQSKISSHIIFRFIIIIIKKKSIFLFLFYVN